MLKWVWLFGCLIFSMALSAQKVSVSAEQKISSKTPRFKILGKNLDGIVVRKYGRETEIVDLYDAALNLKFSKQLNLKNNNAEVEQILLNTRGATVFYSYGEKDKELLQAKLLNSRYELSDQLIALDSMQLSKGEQAGPVYHRISQDKSQLLFYRAIVSGNRLLGARIVRVNKQLEVLSRKTIKFDASSDEILFVDAIISNSGRAYLVFEDEEINQELGEMNYYTVHSWDQDGAPKAIETLIVQRDVFGDFNFTYDNMNEQLTMSGFYTLAEKKAKQAANGFFFMRYEPDSYKILQETYMDFTDEFMIRLTGRDKAEEHNSLYTFKIRDVILRRDGGGVIMAESYYRDSEEIRVPGMMGTGFSDFKTINVYHYNDIVGFSIAPDGAVDWYSIMRKRQLSENDNGAYSSFCLFNDREKLHLIYMDEIYSRSSVNVYRLDAKGENQRDLLFNQEDKDVMILPKLGVQVGPREMVMPSFKRNILRMVKLNF